MDIGKIRPVAAHDGDVTGAIRAGAKAAFIARPGILPGDLSERPHMISPGLGATADDLFGKVDPRDRDDTEAGYEY